MQNKNVLEILSYANQYSYSDMPVALIYADVALEKARKRGSAEEVFSVQRDIGFIYEDNAILDKAIEAYESAAKTATGLHDTLKTTIFNDLAIVSRKIGNFKASYSYYERVLELAEKATPVDYFMLAGAYHGLGHLHREVGIYDKAISYYLKSLDISTHLKETVDLIVSHIDIADTYAKAKELNKALEHIDIAYRLANQQRAQKPDDLEAKAQLASATNRFGEILDLRGQYDKALQKYEEALTIYRGMNYKAYIARTLMLIAEAYQQQKKYDQSENFFKQCLQYETQFINVDQAELHYKLGTLYREQKRLSEAEREFLKGLELANKYDYKEIIQKANYQMFLVRFEKNDRESALKYLNLANALNDSIFSIEKARSVAGLEIKFNSEKRENELNSLKARENRLFLILSIGVFLMIVLFLSYTIQLRGRNYRSLKLKNEEIQNQYKRLEESNEILSQFAYVVAHDLKEPLRSIGSYIGLIQMKHGKDLPDSAKEYMQFVNAGVKRMYSLLTDLLDFSQVVSQQPGAEVIRPEEVLEDVKANLHNAIQSKNAQIEYSDNLPSIRMNRLHLLQLFQNLIGNALKFTTQVPIVRIEGKEDNGQIILTIADNGIGIKKDFSNKVFVLFQQLNKKGQFEGTGIGLTICKNIVEKYNGRIWFDSEENMGTKFYISIPAQGV
ncbi:MAG: tetratricopeptide repeat protein [Saprospiraceae bacterium]|nr:tetratricopeptide repeat protein [Saprospiraceae bacterium]